MLKKYAKAVYQQLEIVDGRFGEHKLTDWAAALTYYSVLSIFPALLVLVSVLGFLGHGTQEAILDTINDLPAGPAKDILLSAFKNLQGATGAATTALLVGVLVAIYSASAYVGAFIRASGIIREIKETRRFYVTIPLRIGLLLILMILAVLTASAIVLTGPIMQQFEQLTGFDGSSIGGWGVVKWPIVTLLFLAALGVLYSFGPDYEKKRFRFATAGTVLAFVLWVVASALFSLYVGNFGHYNKVFGSLAGVAVFLIWLYISNLAVLLGLEFDHELSRYKRVHGYGAFSRRRFQSEESEEPR